MRPRRSAMAAAASAARGSGARIALVAIAVALGSYRRIADVSEALLFGDEFHSVRELARGYRFVLTTYSPHGSGMALPLLQRGLADLFGLNHWTLRLPALVGGIATLALTYPLGRRLVGEAAAAVATCLVASSSVLIFYSHFGRSYSLATCLSLLLVFALQRVASGGRAEFRFCAGSAVLVSLIPYVHLASLGLVLAVGGGALLALGLQRRRRDAVALAAGLAAGLSAALLMHLPAWPTLEAFLRKRASWEYFGEFGFSDVAALLVGSRAEGLALAALLAVALARMAVRERERALPLVLGCVAPALGLLVTRPYGDAYAYARYASVSLPLGCLAIGWLVREIVVRWGPAAIARERTVLALGAALGAWLYLVGPLGIRRADDGPHGNTYLGLYPLPAFDALYEGPAFYRQLAAEERPLRIIEAPALTDRSRHLYRSYYLLHRKATWLGVLPQELPLLPEGPYVALADPRRARESGADYLLLHLEPLAEVERYWRFLYEQPHSRGAAVEAFMQRHSRREGVVVGAPAPLRLRLRQALGAPVYADETIEVWRLAGQAPEQGGSSGTR